MRVMVIVKATKESEAGVMPGAELLQDMGAFNQQLIAAGIMTDGGGLKPTAQGARVAFSGNDRTVSKGPFGNVEDLVSGYWIWKVNDLDEAISMGQALPQSDARAVHYRDPAVLRDGGFWLTKVAV